ncbi:hypothetical protein Hdeb2414_s0058g00759391 [Helianthus debilis subsp. tardiflorus]
MLQVLVGDLLLKRRDMDRGRPRRSHTHLVMCSLTVEEPKKRKSLVHLKSPKPKKKKNSSLDMLFMLLNRPKKGKSLPLIRRKRLRKCRTPLLPSYLRNRLTFLCQSKKWKLIGKC